MVVATLSGPGAFWTLRTMAFDTRSRSASYAEIGFAACLDPSPVPASPASHDAARELDGLPAPVWRYFRAELVS